MICLLTLLLIIATITICTIKNRLDVRYVILYLLHNIIVTFSLIRGITENRDTITEHPHSDICPIGMTYPKNALLINISITLNLLLLTLRFFSDPIHIARPTCTYSTLASMKHLRAWYTRFSPNPSIVLVLVCINSKYLCSPPLSLSLEFHLIPILRVNPLTTIHLYSPLSNDLPFHI